MYVSILAMVKHIFLAVILFAGFSSISYANENYICKGLYNYYKNGNVIKSQSLSNVLININPNLNIVSIENLSKSVDRAITCNGRCVNTEESFVAETQQKFTAISPPSSAIVRYNYTKDEVRVVLKTNIIQNTDMYDLHTFNGKCKSETEKEEVTRLSGKIRYIALVPEVALQSEAKKETKKWAKKYGSEMHKCKSSSYTDSGRLSDYQLIIEVPESTLKPSNYAVFTALGKLGMVSNSDKYRFDKCK